MNLAVFPKNHGMAPRDVDVGVLIPHGGFYDLAEFVHGDPPPEGQEPLNGLNAELIPLL
jgi:hypothetical protein